MTRQALPQNKIGVPDLQALSDNARRQSQETELQLRVMAVQSATSCAERGEELQTTLARIKALGDYLYTGVVPQDTTK